VDIAAWLRGLGLGQYESAFRANDVDALVLPRLTAEDLISIGVTSVGHRRRLLDAIVALGAEAPPATVPIPAVAERRQLTVMVGSTALSARLDPEDYREVIAAYHRAIAKIIAESDGFVSRYLGDGVLVYFGYPQAHEDDAERAGRAGLACIDAVGRTANNPLIDRMITRFRSIGGELIPKGAVAARRAIAVLRRGAHVTMLADQKMTSRMAWREAEPCRHFVYGPYLA